MSSHPMHAAALERILVGEDGDRAFELSELARCPECARIVAEHRRLLSDLEALAADERGSLADVAPVASGRAEAALRQHVRAGVDLAPKIAPGRGGRRMLAAAAVVLAIAIFGAYAWRRASSGDDAHELGPDTYLLHPTGTVAQYAPFRWDVELPAGGHFVVHVEGEGLAITSPWLTTQEWVPPDTSAWPARIRWRLEVYRASGASDLVASYVAWARR